MNSRPYKCETCGKTFGRNTLRTAHMRVSRKVHFSLEFFFINSKKLYNYCDTI